jgi:hypothetical protein
LFISCCLMHYFSFFFLHQSSGSLSLAVPCSLLFFWIVSFICPLVRPFISSLDLSHSITDCHSRIADAQPC